MSHRTIPLSKLLAASVALGVVALGAPGLQAAPLVLGDAPPCFELAESDSKWVELSISGTHCAACTVKIRKALKAQKGVVEIAEGQSKKHLKIKYRPVEVTAESLVKVVVDVGYQAKIVK